MRATFTVIHRWAGLFIAVFLAIAGLTGAVISWDHELDEWLNPHLYDAKAEGAPLPPLELVKKAEDADPRGKVTFFPLQFEQGHNAESLRRAACRSQDRRALLARLQSGLHRPGFGRDRRQALLGRRLARHREHPAVPLQAPLLDAHSGLLGHRPLGHVVHGPRRHRLDVRLFRRLLPHASSPFAQRRAGSTRQRGSDAGHDVRGSGRRHAEIMVGSLGPGVEDQARRLELPPQPRSASRLRLVAVDHAAHSRLHLHFHEPQQRGRAPNPQPDFHRSRPMPSTTGLRPRSTSPSSPS